MIRIILEGFTLGLSAGIYCVGACFVFFVPYLLVEGKQKIFENLRKIASFMLGRFIAYVAFALIMGFIKSSYQGIFISRFSYICLIAASSLMLAYSLGHNFKDSGFCARLVDRFSLIRIPFVLGLFTGLNPCPPFLVGATRLWTLHSTLGGVILFIAFFAGTSVYMIPLVFVPYLNKSERIKQIGVMTALLSSLWFLSVGIYGLIR
jgi:sulfite exporter TauE/SafE